MMHLIRSRMKPIKRFLSFLASVLAATSSSFAADPDEIILADFESDTYGAWQATGDAFGNGPARGTLAGQQTVTNFVGRSLVNTFLGGDKATGTLTSTEFKITKPYINFLIGGGNYPGRISINLLIDGQVAQSATGHESERLLWHTWQLFPVMGKTARIQIVDDHSGSWGHLNVDHIVMASRHKVNVYANSAITTAMAGVAEAVERAESDPTRPIYHFLPPAQWMNDPNGPLFHKGYYHLFYQHNPFGDQWGHMHWGHARSRDLVTWKHLPIALWPSKELGEDHVFSGSAIINPQGRPMIFYTSIGRGKSATDYAEQWAALGDDDLYTWTKFARNPLIDEKLHGEVKVFDWRDPFLFHHEGKRFVVTGGNLNRGQGGQAVVTLYEAIDEALTEWKYRGVLFSHPDEGVANIECPNFFKLDGRWVLIVSPHREVEYFVGDFDASTGKFTPSSRGKMDYSSHYYAPNCLEDAQGRRVLWGWIRGFKDGLAWNGCLTLPRILRLDAHGQILQTPAPELAKLRGITFERTDMDLTSSTNVFGPAGGDAVELNLEIDRGSASKVSLLTRRSTDGVRSLPITFDGGHLEVAGVKAPFQLGEAETLKLRVFLDKSVLEVYANDRACFSRVLNADPNHTDLAVAVESGLATVKSLQAWSMKSIW